MRFRKVLIANRGEIALRIMRACQELGIRTVAVHSDVDADSLHVRFADEDICIGPAAPEGSYLNIPAILSAAKITGADAIHPGYGFLAENARFAELCGEADLAFIGPSPSAIRTMGDKVTARETAAKCGVPLIPGSRGGISDFGEAKRIASETGYPVILKAAAGGGGRGMRLVTEESGMKTAFETARAEAEKAFGSGTIYMERFVEGARHVEVQIAADTRGDVIHLGERDCSLQRRHQKILEEAPSPAVDGEKRGRMGEAAAAVAKAVGYTTVGTVEFLLTPEGDYYFMEMNTRIQVEHPVTEVISGLDLVKLQIRLAAGKSLGIRQEDIVLGGHAIECRINAEDPAANFAPAPGKISSFHLPGGPGVRVDSHVYVGYEVPANYDSLLAKIIAHGGDRDEARSRMSRSLGELVVEGIPTTGPFLEVLVNDAGFISGAVDISFLERESSRLLRLMENKNGKT